MPGIERASGATGIAGCKVAKERRPAEDLSIEELEALLARKRLERRQARLEKFRQSGRAVTVSPDPIPASVLTEVVPPSTSAEETSAREQPAARRGRKTINQALLLIEVGAVLGLAFVLFSGMGVLRTLNREVAEALAGPTPTPTPLITAVVLPSGHTPPTSPGGAAPNEAEIPANLRPLVQSLAQVPIPTAGPEQARAIFIPVLWNDPAPVVQGDGWEQLKKGVGQHVGTPNPGQKGNMVVSAHNDIFGELFRHLDQLKPGDEVLVSTATRQWEYRVTGVQLVGPTDVSVMAATERATLTMISCYPYLVDNQRIVVTAELVGG
jgi:sortase A